MADRFAGAVVVVRPGDDPPRAMWPFEQEARGVMIEFSREWPKWAQRNYILNPFQLATDESIQAYYVPDERPVLSLAGPITGLIPGSIVGIWARTVALPGRPSYEVEITQVTAGRPQVTRLVRPNEGEFDLTVTEDSLSVVPSNGTTCTARVLAAPWTPRPLQLPFPGEVVGRRFVVGSYPLRGMLK